MKKLYLAIALSLVSATSLAQVRDITDEGLPAVGDAQNDFQQGNFPTLNLPPEIAGGHIQRAWDSAKKGSGILQRDWDELDTVRAQIRSRMVSTLVLPDNDEVEDYSLGDQKNFAIKTVSKQKNKLWVWVRNPGYDTNLNVIGKSGNVYSIYLRGETWNSKNITHQVIRLGNTEPSFINGSMTSISGMSVEQEQALQTLASNFPDIPPEWLQKGCKFDPTRIRLDRRMKGDASLAPETVFRDDCFTYLDWGKGHDARTWPNFSRVEDKIDKLVNFDRSHDGRFTILYTTLPITLRTGDRVVCITPLEKTVEKIDATSTTRPMPKTTDLQ